MAMEIGRIAAWERNLATGDMTWSTDPEALFGFPPGAFGPDQRMFHALHPDDRPRVEAMLEAALVDRELRRRSTGSCAPTARSSG